MYPLLTNKLHPVKCLEDCIPEDEIKGKVGLQVTSTRIRVPKEAKSMLKTWGDVYDYCLEYGERPYFDDKDLGLHYALNKKKYENVMSFAMGKVEREEYNLTPRPWQKEALRLAADQCDRKVSIAKNKFLQTI